MKVYKIERVFPKNTLFVDPLNYDNIKSGKRITDSMYDNDKYIMEKYIDGYKWGLWDKGHPYDNAKKKKVYESLDFTGMLTTVINKHKVFSKPKISEILQNSGECFDIQVQTNNGLEDYVLYYTTKIVDALNKELSVIEYFKSDPTSVSDIVKYVFHEGKLQDQNLSLFFLPINRMFPGLLVTGNKPPADDFLFLYHLHKFTGLEFEEIYRTPGEKDYDIEATVKAIEKGENLKEPIFENPANNYGYNRGEVTVCLNNMQTIVRKKVEKLKSFKKQVKWLIDNGYLPLKDGYPVE